MLTRTQELEAIAIYRRLDVEQEAIFAALPEPHQLNKRMLQYIEATKRANLELQRVYDLA